MRCGAAVSRVGHTGQSEQIHSPETWRRVVVSLIKPVSRSIAVACAIAISCLLRHLRTISRPLAKEAYRNVWLSPPGKAELMVAVSNFSGFSNSAWALAKAPAILPIDWLCSTKRSHFLISKVSDELYRSERSSTLIIRRTAAVITWFSTHEVN
jgi:hypothetical protein